MSSVALETLGGAAAKEGEMRTGECALELI